MQQGNNSAIDYSAALSLEHLERLEVAMSQAEAIEAEAVGERLNVAIDPALLSPSSSLGGARPKTTVIDGSGQLWIAKFPSRHDRWNNAIVEAAYLRLASEFGIRTPEACILRIGDRCVLLVRRFDQSPGPSGAIRKPFLSAHALLGSDESVTDRRRWSYIELAHILRRIGARPVDDARELYKRTIFNALTSNEDDHPRNHAVIWDGDGWRLSPAYDLTPSSNRSQDKRLLAMDIGRLRDHIRSRWRPLVEEIAEGIEVADLIEHAFPDRYPGFEYDPVQVFG